MREGRIAIAAAMIAAFAAPCCAAVIYSEDFQKKEIHGWFGITRGGAQLWNYKGNISIRFAGGAAAGVDVDASGHRAVIVRLGIAGLGLGPDDACYGEVSADSGQSWTTVLSLRRGRDDGLTLAAGALGDPAFDGAPRLLIRFRAATSRAGAACWGDNVQVTGFPILQASSASLPGAALPLAPVAASAFGWPGGAGPPAPLAGRLSLRPKPRPDALVPLVALPRPELAAWRARWPDLDVDLVSDGERVIPLQRGPIPAGAAAWEWVVEPGRAWAEPGRRGLSRLVLPVALMERNANCLHNGRLTLLYGADGALAADPFVQFDDEACAYEKFDAWTFIPAAFHPGRAAGADAAVARDRALRAARLPVKPLSELAAAHRGLDAAALSRAAGPFAVWGVVEGGVNYVGACPTRTGPDLACDERTLPSYSAAKTLVGAVALLRLEKLYPGAAIERVAAHTPACAAAGGWDDVRLIDLLDMASGHYASAENQADEGAPATISGFFIPDTAAQKLAFACGQPRKEKPGGRWVYHTADAFLLGAAAGDVLRARAGAGKDLYDDLVRPTWAALRLSPDLDDVRRTYDDARTPATGFGLVFTRDDLARAAQFLAAGARLDGQAQLDEALLGEALQRTDPGGGLVAGLPILRYRHGIWARDVGPLIGCRHAVWAPFLAGFGGVSVVLFPNDVIFYAVGDEGFADWAAAAPEVDKIRPLCR